VVNQNGEPEQDETNDIVQDSLEITSGTGHEKHEMSFDYSTEARHADVMAAKAENLENSRDGETQGDTEIEEEAGIPDPVVDGDSEAYSPASVDQTNPGGYEESKAILEKTNHSEEESVFLDNNFAMNSDALHLNPIREENEPEAEDTSKEIGDNQDKDIADNTSKKTEDITENNENTVSATISDSAKEVGNFAEGNGTTFLTAGDD
jgi:hypothetical protein